VGCHFDQLGEPNRWDNYFFFINGTSQESLIPFVDFVPFVAVQNGETFFQIEIPKYGMGKPKTTPPGRNTG
jgi:hypothetical protein